MRVRLRERTARFTARPKKVYHPDAEMLLARVEAAREQAYRACRGEGEMPPTFADGLPSGEYYSADKA